jgi:hypothetical protein
VQRRGPRAAGSGTAAVGDRLSGGLGGLDGGEHEARGAKVQRLLGPDGAGLREAEHGGGARGVQCAKAGERLGDPARPVLHVDDDVVVAGEGDELGKGTGEGEEEQNVQGVSGGEAGLEGGRGREEVGCRGRDRDGGAPPTARKPVRDAVLMEGRGVDAVAGRCPVEGRSRVGRGVDWWRGRVGRDAAAGCTSGRTIVHELCTTLL